MAMHSITVFIYMYTDHNQITDVSKIILENIISHASITHAFGPHLRFYHWEGHHFHNYYVCNFYRFTDKSQSSILLHTNSIFTTK